MGYELWMKNGKKIIPYVVNKLPNGNYRNDAVKSFSAFWLGTPDAMGVKDYTKPTIFDYELMSGATLRIAYVPANVEYEGSTSNSHRLNCIIYDKNGNELRGAGYDVSYTNTSEMSGIIITLIARQNVVGAVFNEENSDKWLMELDDKGYYMSGVGSVTNKPFTAKVSDGWIYPSQVGIDGFRESYTIVYCSDNDDTKNATKAIMNGSIFEDENDIGGNSSVGGGGGSHFTESDIINIPSLPTSNMLANRMISCYGINNDGLNNLASFLWSDNFINSLKKLYDSPMQNIIDLSIMPIDYSVYEPGAVKIGNVITDASGDLIDKQFYEIDLGSLDCSEIWGSALDYAPYTRALLYLPFIGYVPIDTNKIMGTTISIKYHVDIVTGDCVAFVQSDEQLVLMRNGNMKTHIELSSSNNIERYKAFAQLVGATVTSSVSPISSAEVALSSALTVAMGKPIYETAGNFSSTSGLMSPRYAFIVYSRPNQCLPKKYKSFNGYPSFITSKLVDLSGFTSVNQVHLEGINATDEELTEIEDLLKKGVIL